MTTGSTLYLVSACGTAEEFVAAFRRYADRTGLFIPSAAPLPAGRRGRLALTLKDGGVMIEGEAEILQSSSKATVLHGRPGMTVKFVDADDVSKVVIAELEKARLAMKPAPPSVPPRPAQIPAGPRPVVPATGGRIDAANALAECVVIGDPAQLVDTGAPKVVADSGSGKAKFVVPSIPGVGSPRPNSPSTPPPMGPGSGPIPVGGPGSGPTSRPHTPSTPPPLAARPKTPSVPPDPTSQPLPSPAKASISSRMTSVGFPILDKAPAFPPKTNVPGAPPAENPLLQTKHGTEAPVNRPVQTSGTSPVEAPAVAGSDEATAIGEVPPTPPTKRTDPMPAARPMSGAMVPLSQNDEATTIGEVPPKKKTDPMPAASAPQTPAAAKSGSMLPASDATPAASKSGSLPVSVAAAKAQRATSIGFPAMRSPFETQALGTVRPAAPVVPEGVASKPGQPQPRGKNPTRPPLTPRHPTPVAPVPIVRSPAKAAPHVEAMVENAIVEEENTDLSGVPQAPANAGVPLALAETVDSGGAYRPPAQPAQRSGGMRASEILAAIPSDDWTMAPDASAPTVLPTSVSAKPAVASEPTPAPGMPPKGPPTGNWSISLDPDVGWSDPVKLEKSAEPAPAPAPPKKVRKGTGTAGNPDITVSSKSDLTAQDWGDKPTGIGEAKIEIDSTLMEPLKPMPPLDDEEEEAIANAVAAAAADDSAADARGIPPPLSAGIRYITPPAGMPAAPGGPFPTPAGLPAAPAGPYPTPASGLPASVTGGYASAQPNYGMAPEPSPFAAPSHPNPYPAPQGAPPAGGLFTGSRAASQPVNPSAQYGVMGFPSAGDAPADAAGKRKRTIMIAGGAVVALIAGFALVLALSGGKGKSKGKPSKANATSKGSGADKTTPAVAPRADAAVAAVVETGSAGTAGSGSAAAVVEGPVDAGVAVEDKPPVVAGGACKVSITSVPSAADIYQDDKKLGTTPHAFELPCGVEAKLSLRKAKFINTTRAFTPVADKANKLAVKLAKPTFTVKVTSTPAGATITVGGKPMGVTPGTIRLPAYDPSPVMVSKPGYATDSKVVTPKSNNISHHVTLKKGRR